jgi:MFS superfamily sulfate permease-like transporter
VSDIKSVLVVVFMLIVLGVACGIIWSVFNEARIRGKVGGKPKEPGSPSEH